MDRHKILYSSRAPVKYAPGYCKGFQPKEFHISRMNVGVLICSLNPLHAGLRGPSVDIEYSRIAIRKETFGRSWPLADAQEQTLSATDATIQSLDELIEELTAHRDRLQAERDRIAQHGLTLPVCPGCARYNDLGRPCEECEDQDAREKHRYID